jgi:glutathionyl-hydroquinone reductase
VGRSHRRTSFRRGHIQCRDRLEIDVKVSHVLEWLSHMQRYHVQVARTCGISWRTSMLLAGAAVAVRAMEARKVARVANCILAIGILKRNSIVGRVYE